MPTPSHNCCPEGYTYLGITPNYPNGICQTFNAPYSYTDPIDCPCCPDNYYYDNIRNGCYSSISPLSKDSVASIPCITCVCQDPIVPECGPCGSTGVPINYTFNFFTKACTDCKPDASVGGPNCKQNAFMPYFINVPTLQGFKLDS